MQMSENNCYYPTWNQPGSYRYTPSHYTRALLIVMLTLVLIVVPAAAASPTVTGIVPASGINTTTVSITDLDGTNFLSGATVMLTPENVHPFHKGSIADSGSFPPLLNNSYSIFVSGNYAYVASAGSNALEIVDVSNPANPVHKGSIQDGTGGAFLNNPYGVFVSGNYAYVTSAGSNALEIIDVTDPANPIHKSSIVDGGGFVPCLSLPSSVYVSGNYAYVASLGSNALEIVNVTDPSSPVHVGRLDDGGGIAPFLYDPRSVYVSGNYAYVASTGDNSLEIVDVTDAANPAHKGSIQDGNGGALLKKPYSIFVSGSYAYVASHDSSALEIVDIGTITATNVNVVSATQITGTVNLTGKLAGPYNVVVTNVDGQFGTLESGFTIIESTPTPTPSPTPTPTPSPTPTPIPTPTYSPTPTSKSGLSDNGGTDSDQTPIPTQLPRSIITVNVGGDSGVYQASVMGTGHSGLIITGTLASGPGQSISPAPGTVYKYIDLQAARYATIDKANISFTVPQSWIDEHHLTPQDIALYRLTNTTWEALPTTLVKTDNGRSYYMALTPGFSRFAVTGKIKNTSGNPVQVQNPQLQTFGDIAQATSAPPISTLTSTSVSNPTTQEPVTQPQTQLAFGFPVMTMIGIGIIGIIILIGLTMYIQRKRTQ